MNPDPLYVEEDPVPATYSPNPLTTRLLLLVGGVVAGAVLLLARAVSK